MDAVELTAIRWRGSLLRQQEGETTRMMRPARARPTTSHRSVTQSRWPIRSTARAPSPLRRATAQTTVMGRTLGRPTHLSRTPTTLGVQGSWQQRAWTPLARRGGTRTTTPLERLSSIHNTTRRHRRTSLREQLTDTYRSPATRQVWHGATRYARTASSPIRPRCTPRHLPRQTEPA